MDDEIFGDDDDLAGLHAFLGSRAGGQATRTSRMVWGMTLRMLEVGGKGHEDQAEAPTPGGDGDADF